ncbi:MAG: hypothetical protein WDM79_10920 [Terricaulis sp.]
MVLRSLLVTGLVGLVSLIASVATAEDAMAPTSPVAFEGVSFFDPRSDFADAPVLDLTIREDRKDRFFAFSGAPHDDQPLGSNRRYEVALGARQVGGLPVDVSIAQRASFGFNDSGDLARHGRGSELRLGRGVAMRRQQAATWDKPIWYAFLASDDEALTWNPGSRGAFGGSGPSFALQDRVEIGDIQAGVTYEVGGLQASLAYVEREVSTHSGSQSFSQDENFTGLTITMRR